MRARQTASGDLLWKISVSIAAESEDAVTALMAAIFEQPAAVYADLERRRVVAFVFVEAVLPCPLREFREGIKAIRRAGLEIGSGRITVRPIRRENWAESWKRHFKPLAIHRKLLVLPSWSKRRSKPGQAVVVLDPGLSFGTGQHTTTAFCLEQIVSRRIDLRQQSLLDVGCGSGILSIAAAKVGYSPVVGFDFDPDAVRVARENAEANHVCIDVSLKDLTKLPLQSDRQFDVVCANLIYDLLIGERRRILGRLRAGGTLVLAGILKEQFPKVQRTYEAGGLRLVVARTAREWRSGAFCWRS